VRKSAFNTIFVYTPLVYKIEYSSDDRSALQRTIVSTGPLAIIEPKLFSAGIIFPVTSIIVSIGDT
jgi:hypothetical protein